jgi:hypothetical protein
MALFETTTIPAATLPSQLANSAPRDCSMADLNGRRRSLAARGKSLPQEAGQCLDDGCAMGVAFVGAP